MKHRISSYAVYLIVFIVACAPWFAANYFETGSMLSTRNLESIVREFYGGTNAARAPEGGFASLGALIIYDPISSAKHYFTNIPWRIWLDMRHALGLVPGFLVLVGFLRFLFVPPTRRQWAFLVYPFGLFLAGCFVFYLPRFSIPWVPAYFAIGYSVIFGSGAITRSRLGIGFERAIAKHIQWLNKDLIGDRKSGIDKANIRADKKLHKRARSNKAMRDRLVFPRLTPGVIAVVLAIGFIFNFQVTCSVGGVKAYYEGRPLFIFDAAEFLKVHHSTTGGTERPIIMARKPHIAYYADFTYQTYPRVLNTSIDYLTFAIRNNVNYIVYSELERKYYTASELLTRLDAVPGVKKIYNKPDIIVYQLEDWINIREEAGKNALAVLHARLKTALETNQHDSVVNIGSEIVGLYAVNGEWAEVERYLLVQLRAAEQMSDPAIANRYIYPIRRSLAQAYRKLGEHEKGIALLMQDREFYESRGDKTQLANIHFQLSVHYKELGDKEKALDHYRASYELYISIGDMKNAKAIQGFIEALQADK